MFPDVAAQMKVIERGALEIFPHEELVKKLERSRAKNQPLRIKLGIDPTAPDIHIGHAVPIGKLKHFQDLGHQVVLIIGDYTGMVGDPSGRDSTRPQLTHEQVLDNARTYLDQAAKILDLSRAEVVRNGDWFGKMTFIDVIRLTSRMTVARLLERDDFSTRFKAGEPISCHEFIYPLMQGYDSVMVRADVEIGGNDQTFNLLVGRNFQKEEGQEPQVALTLPLLVGLDGKLKMSKSYGNHIGVNDPPNAMYGKTMSIPDELLRTYFDLTTDTPSTEMEDVIEADPMKAKMELARALVTRYHGAEAAREAAAFFDRTVRCHETPAEMPEIALGRDLLTGGKAWIARVVVHCGFAPSTSQAQRLVAQGAVSLDGEVIADSRADVAIRDGAVLKVGKRHFARLIRKE